MKRRAWLDVISASQIVPSHFPKYNDPLISVIVYSDGNLPQTARSLVALQHDLHRDAPPCEVVVVDDGSTDGSQEYLATCAGIVLIRNETPLGFAQCANHGARAASGRYLYFLCPRTIVTPGWSRPLLRAFESERVGAACSQICSPDGTVRSAGGIVWADGAACAFGAGLNPASPDVAYSRDVDSVQTTGLIVSATAFERTRGFSAEFESEVYIGADLCMQLRTGGHAVRYCPESVVIDVGCDNAEIEVQRCQAIFANKWQQMLTSQYAHADGLVAQAARRLSGARTALVLDSFIPFEDRSAGARRIFAIMQLMRALGWHVIFVAHDGGEYEPYTSRARQAGIEVIPHGGDAARTIRALPVPIDLAWISRPDLARRYLPIVRECTNAKVIYDTVDLHFVRLQRQAAITGRQTPWRKMRSIELSLAAAADHTVVTMHLAQALLHERGITSTVMPIVEPLAPTRTVFSARQGILFLGNYSHKPNVDAVGWLVNHVMPIVWERIPEAVLTLAGSDPTPEIHRLASARITITDYVSDLRALFEQKRVFAAPVRFGAGMKGKVVQSLAHGLPVVTTSIGAEGIGLSDGCSALIRDDAVSFADALVRLYSDESLWERLHERSLHVAAKFTPQAVKPLLEETLARVFTDHKEGGVNTASNAAGDARDAVF